MDGLNGAINPQTPTHCAECGTLLSDALVLVCGHDLCLQCAAAAFRQTAAPGMKAVRCFLCGTTTSINDSTAQTLSGMPTFGAPVAAQFAAPSVATSNIMGSANSGYASAQSSVAQVPASATAVPVQLPMSPRSGMSAPMTVTRARTINVTGTPPVPVVVPVTPVSPRAISPRTVSAVACPEHPTEAAMYFCVTCECACVCADCVVYGRHQGHEVMKISRAHDALRARAGALLDEALALEDDFAVVKDKLSWRRKDIERAAARGRASVRSAFARVRAQLADRENELLSSLDSYENGSLHRLDGGSFEQETRLRELRVLQDNLRGHCRSGDAVLALNAYAAAKRTIISLREAFRENELSAATVGHPDDFVGLAGSARAELDLHAEGLASLEEAVATLCVSGVEFSSHAPVRADAGAMLEQASHERFKQPVRIRGIV